MKKQIIRITGMVVIGVSMLSVGSLGFWMVIPWCIGWAIYDSNVYF